MRRFWRWRGRGDAGGAQLPIMVAVLIVVATTPIWVPIAQDINDVLHGRWNPKEKEAPAPTAKDIPFIGPGLPSDPVKKECVEKAAAGIGLHFTDKGWRTSDIDEPSLVGQPATVRAGIQLFERRMNNYVGSRQMQWAKCLQDLPPALPPAPLPPAVSFAGTYVLEIQGGNCPRPPTTATVGQTDQQLSITLAFPVEGTTGSLATVAITAAGTLGSDQSFALTASQSTTFFDQPAQLNVRIRGRFDYFEPDTLIRNGILEVELVTKGQAPPCTTSFTGRKQ